MGLSEAPFRKHCWLAREEVNPKGDGVRKLRRRRRSAQGERGSVVRTAPGGWGLGRGPEPAPALGAGSVVGRSPETGQQTPAAASLGGLRGLRSQSGQRLCVCELSPVSMTRAGRTAGSCVCVWGLLVAVWTSTPVLLAPSVGLDGSPSSHASQSQSSVSQLRAYLRPLTIGLETGLRKRSVLPLPENVFLLVCLGFSLFILSPRRECPEGGGPGTFQHSLGFPEPCPQPPGSGSFHAPSCRCFSSGFPGAAPQAEAMPAQRSCSVNASLDLSI